MRPSVPENCTFHKLQFSNRCSADDHKTHVVYTKDVNPQLPETRTLHFLFQWRDVTLFDRFKPKGNTPYPKNFAFKSIALISRPKEVFRNCEQQLGSADRERSRYLSLWESLNGVTYTVALQPHRPTRSLAKYVRMQFYSWNQRKLCFLLITATFPCRSSLRL